MRICVGLIVLAMRLAVADPTFATESFSGRFTRDGSEMVVALSQNALGKLSGSIAGVGEEIEIVGSVRGRVATGTLSSSQGTSDFEATIEGPSLTLVVTDRGKDGKAMPETRQQLVFVRDGARGASGPGARMGSATEGSAPPPDRGTAGAKMGDYRSAALTVEGNTLDAVQVPPGAGDGRVTERDALALAEYCVWGFNQVLAANGVKLTLGRDAEDRMIQFWVFVWDHLDAEDRATISNADVIWSEIRKQVANGDDSVRLAHAQQFLGIMDEVWGGLEIPTIRYLAGDLPPASYAQLIEQAIAAEEAANRPAGRGRGGSGGGQQLSGWEPTVSYDPGLSLESTTISDGGVSMSYD